MTRRPLSALALLALAGALLAACGGPAAVAPTAAAPTAVAEQPTTAPTTDSAKPTTAPTTDSTKPTATPAANAAPDEAAVKDGIQKTLDLYSQAYNENKPELLQQAADQTNLPFRRFIQTRFDNFVEAGLVGQVTRNYKVKSVKARDQGFWQAQVTSNGYVADWTFRQLDGRWVMSEPTKDQIGKKETVQGKNFTFIIYPWAGDVNQKLMELMEKARQNVFDRLGKVPDQKAEVTIKPIFGVGKPENPNTLAYYDRAGRAGAPDKMVIFAPESYVFQFYDPSTGWEPELESTLTHEYTHLVNNRSFTPIARMNDWMVEGLAEFVSHNPRADEVSAAVAADKVIPIMDTSGQVNKQDLEHLTILNTSAEISLGYGLGYSLVAYINEKYGGMDGFWKVVNAYDKSQKFDQALQEAFGVSYADFDKGWRAWLKEKY